MNGFHHNVNGRVKEFLSIFRVEVSDEFSGVFDVGKQHGDLLAFTFQGTARGEDFLGEILGGVGDGERLLIGSWD
jgi:hypothetical protein